MKVIPLILTLSLAGNLAISGWEYCHKALLFTGTTDSTKTSPRPQSNLAGVETKTGPQGAVLPLAAWLQETDLDKLASEIALSDLTADDRKSLLHFLVEHRFHQRHAELKRPQEPKRPYWQPWMTRRGKAEQELEIRHQKLWEEQQATLKRLQLVNTEDQEGPRYTYLETAKARELQTLEKDYDEMRNKIWMEQEGFSLPSDQKRLSYLEEQEKQEREALLSPEDKRLLELHESGPAHETMRRYGAYLRSEQEYTAAYEITKEADERRQALYKKSVRWDSEEMQKVNRDMESKMEALLGTERMANYRDENDPDRRLNEAAVRRLHLMPETEANLKAVASRLQEQAKLIEGNSLLVGEAKEKACEELKRQATSEVRTLLGEEGAEAYAARSQWMRRLPKVKPAKPQELAAELHGGSGCIID